MDNQSEYIVDVAANGPRPDFRLFIPFLWNEEHDVDSDGNSYNPASRTWTYLYMSSREIPDQTFEINEVSNQPIQFRVISTNEHLANRVAYFLARETNGDIIGIETGKEKIGDFNLEQALERADKSIWRKSTLENPYPNRNLK
jgi:hypothetical protein